MRRVTNYTMWPNKGHFCFTVVCILHIHSKDEKKVNRKVQGMPQSQTASNPRHQEEEKKDKNIHAQNETNMYEKHKGQLPLPQVR